MKSNRRVSLTFIVAAAATLSLSAAASSLRAADANSASPPKLPEAPFVGEYVGPFIAADGKTLIGVAKVYFDPTVKPNGGYRATLYAVESGLIYGTVIGEKTKCESSDLLTGEYAPQPANDPRLWLLLEGDKFKGSVDGDNFRAGSKAGTFQLTRYERKSPTLGAAPPAEAIVLLDYKPGTSPNQVVWTNNKWKTVNDSRMNKPGKAPSLAEWTNKKWKAFNDGSVMVVDGSNYTVRTFKNFRLHAEFMVVSDKGGGNSGFYLLDRYEVQVLDSFGRVPGKGNCASIYLTFPPSANACLPAGAWQTFDITFRGPVMEGKEVKKHPRITVVHNGVTVHDDVEIPHATGVARARGDVAEGPIMLQDHDSPARFRNIWLVEIAGQ